MKVETGKYFSSKSSEYVEPCHDLTIGNMKYSNNVSQQTGKLQVLAYIEKKIINLKRHKRIPTKQLKANVYIPFNKVPG